MRPERQYALAAMSRYWPQAKETLADLPVPDSHGERGPSPYSELAEVPLPEWAGELAPDGFLLVPDYAVTSGDGPEWKRADWFEAAFWYLNGTAERAHENKNGPVHSYSFRLKDFDPRMWERAWVNRIALFLRRWAAREKNLGEEEIFGPLPETEIILTHDVDAVDKTLPIRLKQTAFHLFNALRGLGRGEIRLAARSFGKSFRFLLSSGDYWRFDRVLDLEQSLGVHSHFNFYAGPIRRLFRHPKLWLLDPAYSIEEPRFQSLFKRLCEGRQSVGLHPSFESWPEPAVVREEKERFESVLQAPVVSSRQHWLRFSWGHTWKALQEAGIQLDSTLGFNDRPAFRNGGALRFFPWEESRGATMQIEALPLVFMDSHFYDYACPDDCARKDRMRYWIEEIRDVRGTATILWHPRTLSPDYGWEGGFRDLLDLAAPKENHEIKSEE